MLKNEIKTKKFPNLTNISLKIDGQANNEFIKFTFSNTNLINKYILDDILQSQNNNNE